MRLQNVTFTQNLKMRLIGYIGLLFILLLSCDDQKKLDYFEGLLIYETDDQMLNNVPVDSGKFVKYFVKGDSIRVESYTAMGKQVHLRDYSTQSGVLIFVFGGEKIALLQDLSKDTIKRGFQIDFQNERKSISGIVSKKAILSGAYLEQPISIFYAPHLPNHILDIYDGIIPGLPTKYQIIVQQIPVNYSLVKLEQKTIESSNFQIPDDCLILTMEEFMALISQQDFLQ